MFAAFSASLAASGAYAAGSISRTYSVWLGWVWEVGKNEAGHLRARCYPDASKEPASDWGAWSAWGPRGEATFQIAYWNAELTGDALIALAHGRFLLADALREAGQ